jgi:MoaA/NifB/PqqE/SkfB family radical SAM enzyme
MDNNIWRVTIDTNPEDCNLHCIMCEEHSEFSSFKEKLYIKTGVKRRVMPKELIRKIISEASELGVREIIPTTMGDPLVSDNFEYIADLVVNKNLRLNVTHNGTFPRKSVEKWAAIIVPITSDIKISWNGGSKAIAEGVMKGLNFEKAVMDLSAFIKWRNDWFDKTGHLCTVSLQLTFMRSNMHEIELIIKLAAELGVDRIKGHHVWVNFTELQPLSFFNTEESISEWNSIVEMAEAAVKKYKKKDGKSIRLENFDFISNPSNKSIPDNFNCPFLGKELWISATGIISPCCAPDNLRRTLGHIGNISDTSLKQVVDSEQYMSLVKNYKTNKLCKSCTMRKP